ncbi:MAG TPA: ATP-binding protein [Bacteroidia bacterium]|nr:ATP-binding protein [Bacteroidia bacterium]
MDTKSKLYVISRPIILVFAIISLFLVLFGMMNLNHLNKFESNIKYIKEISFEQLILLNTIKHNAGLRKLNILYYLFSQDPISKEVYKGNIHNYHDENEEHYKKLNTLITNETIRQQFDVVQKSRGEYNLKAVKTIELFKSDTGVNPLEYEKTELRPVYTHYIKNLNDLSILIITNSSETIAATQEAVDNNKRIIYLMLIIGILIILFSVRTLARVVKKLKSDYSLLSKSQSALQVLYNESEEEVQKRTKELVTLNMELYNFKEIVELSDNPILITTPDDNITFWNKGAETAYGYSKEEALASNRPGLLNIEFGKPYSKIKEEILENGEWKGEFTAKTKSGKLVNSLTQITLLKDEEGKPISILEVSQDITKRKEIEDEVKKYNQDLKEINEATEKIISVISHDLKNPLAGIVSSSEILKNNVKTLEKEHIKEFSDIIHRSSTKLLQQLNELIAWVKSKQEKASYDPAKARLFLAVNDALAVSLENAKNKDIKIENLIQNEIFIVADTNMLKSIVQNLVNNSIKFTQKGGRILITAHLKGSMAEVHITDNGVGMSIEVKDKLFEKESISETGTENEEGTGMGLKLVKYFVSQNGGEIYIESEEHKGTTVIFTLPLA